MKRLGAVALALALALGLTGCKNAQAQCEAYMAENPDAVISVGDEWYEDAEAGCRAAIDEYGADHVLEQMKN